MNTEAQLATDLVPLIIYFVAVLATTGVMLGGAYFLGQRHTAKAADETYESGIVATGDVHIRFSIQFYLLAIFFVIFDMESVFLGSPRFPVVATTYSIFEMDNDIE